MSWIPSSQDAVRVSGEGLRRLHSDDLVWTRGAALQAGDRVRLGKRLGFVGFRNDDGAPMRLGNNLTQPVFICGRALPTGGVCGGSDGKGRACRACLRFLVEHRGRLIEGERTPLSVHVDFDEAAQPPAASTASDAGEQAATSAGGAPEGGGASSADRHALHLASELERAYPICGVHIEAWNGCAFHNGDSVAVQDDGVIVHRRSLKRVKMDFTYRPLPLSTLANARTTRTTQIVQGNQARRTSGQGGAVIAAEPLVWVRGEASYEVVIKKQVGGGDEGVECGVTTMSPESINLAYDYAAVVRPSWFSSDSGSLWRHGRAYYDEGQWKHTRPINLKAGDVVRLTVKANGALMVHCNGVFQVSWEAANVDTSKPLYAVVGMRAPACGVALRTREDDMGRTGPLTAMRSVTLRGIAGRTGETIDLTKHGRPRYPAAFTNVRAISDIASLYPLLLRPNVGREHGRKGAVPILIRAGPVRAQRRRMKPPHRPHPPRLAKVPSGGAGRARRRSCRLLTLACRLSCAAPAPTDVFAGNRQDVVRHAAALLSRQGLFCTLL